MRISLSGAFTKENKELLLSEKLKRIYLSIIVFSLGLIVLSSHLRLLSWDEVDYFNASSKGILENAFDFNSLGVIHFISFVSWKLGFSSEFLSSTQYSETLDTFLLRHTHPPLLQYLTSYFYFFKDSNYEILGYVVFLARWGLGTSFIIFSHIFSYFIFTKKNNNLSILLVSAFSVYTALLLSIHLQYHILISLSLLFVSFSLVKLLNKTSRENYLLVSLSLVFTILSLETSILIIFTSAALFILFVNKNEYTFLVLVKRIFSYFLLLPAAFTIFLWPASLYKISIIKPYAIQAYRLIAVKEEYSDVFSYSTIKDIYIPLLPYIIALISLTICFYICKQKSINKELKENSFRVPFLIGFIYSIFMIPFALNFTYLAPGLLLCIFPLLTLLDRNIVSTIFINTVSTILFLSILFTFAQLYQLKNQKLLYYEYPGKSSLATINSLFKTEENLTLYVDGGHILKFYLPSLNSQIEDISLIKPYYLDYNLRHKIYTRKSQTYSEFDLDNIRRPAIILLRSKYDDVIDSLDFKCERIELKGLNGSACKLDIED